MVPVGHEPILWHLMQYYSHYGHRDFVLCLGYKANVIKEFFLNYRPAIHADFIISEYGAQRRDAGRQPARTGASTLIDTGLWRNIGERLLAVREHVEGEEMFLANYSDGLSRRAAAGHDRVLREERQDRLLPGRPAQLQLPSRRFGPRTAGSRPSGPATIPRLWINGGFFIFRPEIFDYMREGEELVVEPFQRLIEAGELRRLQHRRLLGARWTR